MRGRALVDLCGLDFSFLFWVALATIRYDRLRQEQEGMNMLTPPKQKPEWLKFLEQLTDFFSLLPRTLR